MIQFVLCSDTILSFAIMTADIQTFGFPPGYFIIRSVATGRFLDVTEDEIEDGTEIILWPEKETSLVESA
jgi:WD repeat-containing protein 23